MPVFISNGSFCQACSSENDVDGKYKLPDVIDVFDHVCHDQEYRHGIDDEAIKPPKNILTITGSPQHAAEMMTAPNDYSDGQIHTR